MDFAQFLTDETKEIEGVWKPLGGGAEARIARLNNDNFKKEFRARTKSNRAILDQDDEASDELTERIVIELMAKHILKDLRGVKVPDLDIFSEGIRGKTIGPNAGEVAFTPKIGLELLRSSEDFARKIRAYAEAQESYSLQIEDDAAKNSLDG